jgi:hypothetical protein
MTRILVVEQEADTGIGLVGERIEQAGAELVVVGPETGRAIPDSSGAYDGVVVPGGARVGTGPVAGVVRIRGSAARTSCSSPAA